MGATRAQRKNAKIWHFLALAHGYNELAKLSDSLGEKIYCRVGRDEAEKSLRELGVDLKKGDRGMTTVTLGMKAPYITLTDADVETMRRHVAEHDLAKTVGK